MIDAARIDAAIAYLQTRVRHTPLEASPTLSKHVGLPVYLKLENLQITGSFKVRGALFAMSQLSADVRAKGVVTCSAGNHGKAVAYAAKTLGVSAEIWVPASVDEAKYRGIQALGANCIRAETQGYDATQAQALAAAETTGRHFLHAFESPDVMAGNGGTVAAEILAACPNVATCLLPVGGGGLFAGFASHMQRTRPQVQLIGCQHRDSPALQRSLEQGHAVTELPFVATTAGGIEGGIGAETFAIIRKTVDDVRLVTEADIFDAVRWLLTHHHYLMEPSCGPVIAACFQPKPIVAQGPVVLVISGRNLDIATLEHILQST